MTSKERLLKAINGEKTDRLPVTTHHLQKFFLDKCGNGIDNEQFFDSFKMDPVMWISPVKTKDNSQDFIQGEFKKADNMQPRPVSDDTWIIEQETIPDDQYPTARYSFISPKKTLTMTLQSNEYTSWVISACFMRCRAKVL